MEDLASDLHTIGLMFMLLGPLLLGVGFLLARNPKFPSWTCATMQYAGIAFMLTGPIYYFQPGGAEIAQHTGGLIFMVALVFMVVRFRRARNADRGKPLQ